MITMSKGLCKYYFIISCLIYLNQSFASIVLQHPAKILVITGGYAASNINQQQQTFIVPDNLHGVYSAKHGNDTSPIVGGAIGLEWPMDFQYHFLLQTLFSYYQTNHFTVRGNLIQGVDVQSQDQYSYQFNIRSQQLFIEGKLLLDQFILMKPYLIIGLGAAFNAVTDYKDSSYCTNMTLTPTFQNHTNVTPAISLGVGVDFSLTSTVRLGLGYRFVELANNEFANARLDGYPVPTILKARVKLQEIVMQFSYLMA